MSVSNVRQLATLHKRAENLRQKMAWAKGEERAALALRLGEIMEKIEEAEERS